MSMKEGTRVENREVSETVAGGKITFTMKQRVVITDMMNLYADGEWTLSIPVKVFDQSIKEDFKGDREAAVKNLCDKSPNWVSVWHKFNRGIAGGPALQHGVVP